jgi:integrase
MATIRFFINQKDSNKECTIHLILKNGRDKTLKKSTGFKVIGKHWDEKKQTTIAESRTGEKNYYEIKRVLPKLKTKLLDAVNVSNYKGINLDSSWLEREIDIFFGRSTPDIDFDYLTDYAKHFIDRLPYRIQKNGTTGVSVATGKQYQTTLNKIYDFEKKQRKRFKVNEVNLKYHNDFIQFLNKEQKLNLNTIGKYIKCLKTVLRSAKQYGLKVNPDVEKDGFRSTKEKTYFVTLNENEIDTIFNLALSNRPYLENARNWLIIGVWTGARVSDLLHFKTSNINNGFIEYTAQKTKQKIMLPLHWQVQSIIDGNDGQFPHRISNQRYNDWIKEVCRLAEIDQLEKGAIYITDKKVKTKKVKTPQRKVIGQYPKWQMVSTHTARRSFATNHYGKLPTPVIMSATGHTTEKMLLAYIGKTAKDNAIILQDFWKKETLKTTKEPQLKVIKNTK